MTTPLPKSTSPEKCWLIDYANCKSIFEFSTVFASTIIKDHFSGPNKGDIQMQIVYLLPWLAVLLLVVLGVVISTRLQRRLHPQKRNTAPLDLVTVLFS